MLHLRLIDLNNVFLYDEENRLTRTGHAAEILVYGLGLISTTDGAGATSYYLPDGLGSTSQLTNSAGAITDRYWYDVFGAMRSQSGATANDFRFTGQQNDSNANRGLYYLRARSYDPSLGRFLQRDTAPIRPSLAQSLNSYAYVTNNPANFVDASGLWCPRDPTDCVPSPVKKGVKAAVDATVSSLNAVGRAAEYCASSSHILECYERGEIAIIGIAVTEFGLTIGVGGCAVIAPVVGAATAVVGGVATCGLAVVAGGIVVSGGVILTYNAFTPWHEASEVPTTGLPSKAANKEQMVTQ